MPAILYTEIPLKLPPGLTCTVDVLGHPRFRVNARDLTHTLVDALDAELREAILSLRDVLREKEDAPRA